MFISKFKKMIESTTQVTPVISNSEKSLKQQLLDDPTQVTAADAEYTATRDAEGNITTRKN